VWIRGRVTDRETGRPVPALVRYVAFVGNPHLEESPGFRHNDDLEVRTGEDGSFALLALPGRGLLAAKAADREVEGRYVRADCGEARGVAVGFTGDELMPVTLRVRACAAVPGRLVDDDGLPRAGGIMGDVERGRVRIAATGRGFCMEGVGTDGRFRIEGVIPG